MAQRAMLVLLLACTKAAPSQPSQSCLDRELSARGLNQYGDPPDTMYPGGTPLFEEKSGKRTDRAEYVFSRHADIRSACASDAGP
jgi:hypothetical protein